MKKIIVCLTLALFAVGASVQAGEGEKCGTSKAACAEKSKTASSTSGQKVSASSCGSKVAVATKSACCASKSVAKRNAFEKGATRLARL